LGSSDQVQEKIDAMVAALKKEQADEVKKKDLPHYGCFFFKRTPLVTNWGKY
jgi:hypothetical protein